ncbi:hypothetical protein J8273_3008 [Carpediemonas membranifera]|uniref:Far11/STRP C-terminal domain-containing protein n=1 Tax=Carpediemonas membranifera TaxID=201153 RepID=A0A8J6E3C7_9EUKA|nr:hypothetical protein J8273_3008 [Carpediemonas membranifera]|eukprot:KAG9395441.1 hypothetical protein J8273_3008 [Carpediemonas membranifera]
MAFPHVVTQSSPKITVPFSDFECDEFEMNDLFYDCEVSNEHISTISAAYIGICADMSAESAVSIILSHLESARPQSQYQALQALEYMAMGMPMLHDARYQGDVDNLKLCHQALEAQGALEPTIHSLGAVARSLPKSVDGTDASKPPRPSASTVELVRLHLNSINAMLLMGRATIDGDDLVKANGHPPLLHLLCYLISEYNDPTMATLPIRKILQSLRLCLLTALGPLSATPLSLDVPSPVADLPTPPLPPYSVTGPESVTASAPHPGASTDPSSTPYGSLHRPGRGVSEPSLLMRCSIPDKTSISQLQRSIEYMSRMLMPQRVHDPNPDPSALQAEQDQPDNPAEEANEVPAGAVVFPQPFIRLSSFPDHMTHALQMAIDAGDDWVKSFDGLTAAFIEERLLRGETVDLWSAVTTPLDLKPSVELALHPDNVLPRSFVPRAARVDQPLFESVYSYLLPDLQRLVIIMVKLLLCLSDSSHAPTLFPPAELLAAHGVAIESCSGCTVDSGDHFHGDIIARNVTHVLALLLGHAMASHPLQGEHVARTLFMSNGLVVLLVALNRNVPEYIKHDCDRNGLYRGLDVSFPSLDSARISLTQAFESAAIDRRRLLTVDLIVALLNGIVADSVPRARALSASRGPVLLKRLLWLDHLPTRVATYSALKAQTPFLGRKWRAANRRVLFGVYENLPTTLGDRSLDSIPGDDKTLATEKADDSRIETIISQFNSIHYGKWYTHVWFRWGEPGPEEEARPSLLPPNLMVFSADDVSHPMDLFQLTADQFTNLSGNMEQPLDTDVSVVASDVRELLEAWGRDVAWYSKVVLGGVEEDDE